MPQNQDIALKEAYSLYVSELKQNQRQGISQDLNRFVQWCGKSGPLTALTPQTIASYSEWVGLSGGDIGKKLEPVKAFLTYLKKKEMVNLSLAPHARVPKSKSRSSIQRNRGVQEESVEMTRAGYRQLTERLATLKLERVIVVKDIGRAMEDKDFRENAPLDAAKERQGLVESMIRELEHTLNIAVVAGKSAGRKAKRVAIGNKVTIKNTDNGRKVSYSVVHPKESSPGDGKISSDSPVGRALLNRTVGEEVEIIAPKGALRYRIEQVRG